MQKWRNESFIDVINLILGGWLFVTPWVFGFAGGAAGWNAWILGAVIALVAIAALTAFAEWEEWINLVLGLWVLVAPWVLGFEANAAATRYHVIVGIVVAALAAIELWLVHRKPPQVTA
jgi:SPW repeat